MTDATKAGNSRNLVESFELGDNVGRRIRFKKPWDPSMGTQKRDYTFKITGVMRRHDGTPVYVALAQDGADTVGTTARPREIELVPDDASDFVAPSLDEVVQSMRHEVLVDIALGRVPDSVRSFSKLHDYVDANGYGGFCEDRFLASLIDAFGGRDAGEALPDKLMALMNDAQSKVDEWLNLGHPPTEAEASLVLASTGLKDLKPAVALPRMRRGPRP
jgi:hypothetical protein